MNLLANTKFYLPSGPNHFFSLSLQVLLSKVTASALTGEEVSPKNRNSVTTINFMSYWRITVLIST